MVAASLADKSPTPPGTRFFTAEVLEAAFAAMTESHNFLRQDTSARKQARSSERQA
jgi:hypothetical protein